MAKSKRPAEFIRPPNTLKAKVGGNGKIDMAAIERAEKALDELKEQFADWLLVEIDRLKEARRMIRDTGGFTKESAHKLHISAHDLKGMGTTYEFPIVTRIAGSLCKLLENVENWSDIPGPLVDAHVDAIHVVVRDGIRSDENAMGKAVAEEFETRVREFIGSQAA